MKHIFKTVLIIKLKMLLRNHFGKSKKIQSWLVLLLALILFNWMLYLFIGYPILLIVLFYLITSIISSHTIDDNSWLDSNIIYPIFPYGIKNVMLNLISELILKLTLLLPSILFVLSKSSSFEYLLVFIAVMTNLIFDFFLVEISFKDLKLKKWFKGILMFYICLFVFTSANSFDLESFSINHNDVFLLFCKKHSTIGIGLLLLLPIIMLSIFAKKYFNFYRYQISSDE